VVKITAALGVLAMTVGVSTAAAQNLPAPRPFPGAPPPPPPPPSTQPADPAPAEAEPVDVPAPVPAQAAEAAPGVPLYPGAVLVAEYNAGNQRVTLYGSMSTFANVVEYYRGILRERGRQLFGGSMHQFDLGRYRRESMTLQPSVTVKDFTWNGREGFAFANGSDVVRYPTIIQVVSGGPER